MKPRVRPFERLMKSNLTPSTLLAFIEGDFMSAWDALARVDNSMVNRGNFMFARQAMVYLEVACRLCHSDSTGRALRALSEELRRLDARYFISLPGVCYLPSPQPEFILPNVGGEPGCSLLDAMFDLVRNGQAHQYQQIPVRLSDGKEWQIGLTGATFGLSLEHSDTPDRRSGHMKWSQELSGDCVLRVCTDILFLDFRSAIKAAQLDSRELSFEYLVRPRNGKRHYQFTSSQLVQAISTAVDSAG